MTIRKMMMAFMVAIPVGLFSAASQAKDIVDTASSNGNFKTLVTALKAAGLVDTLKGKAPLRCLPQMMQLLLNYQQVQWKIC